MMIGTWPAALGLMLSLAAPNPWVTVSHPDYTQQADNTCAPTSAAMTLASMGVHESPASLAKAMRTNGPGTSWADFQRVYNADQPKGWTLTSVRVDTPAQLLSDLSRDVSHGVAVPEGVMVNEVPYWSKIPSDAPHVIVVDGVDLRDKRVRVYDPWYGKTEHGSHTLTAAQLFGALETVNGVHGTVIDIPS